MISRAKHDGGVGVQIDIDRTEGHAVRFPLIAVFRPIATAKVIRIIVILEHDRNWFLSNRV